MPSNISDEEPQLARDQAQRLLARRRRHIRALRKRVIAGSAVAFVAAWAAIGVQLASGHDPSLDKRAQPAASPSSSSSSNTGATTGSTSADGNTTTDSTQSSPSPASPSRPLAPVTTQQS